MIRKLLNNYGVLKTTVIVSVICIVVSLFITYAFWKLLNLQHIEYALLLGFLCPTFIAPPVVLSLCRLTENLQNSQNKLKIYKNELEKRVEKRTRELTKALDKLKTLEGILPICSYCKKIRDDQGSWNQIELYIRDHSNAKFSHSVCPECMKKNYPEEYDSIYPNEKEK